MKLFIAPIVTSIVALAAVYFWGGVAALFLAARCAVSFDASIISTPNL